MEVLRRLEPRVPSTLRELEKSAPPMYCAARSKAAQNRHVKANLLCSRWIARIQTKVCTASERIQSRGDETSTHNVCPWTHDVISAALSDPPTLGHERSSYVTFACVVYFKCSLSEVKQAVLNYVLPHRVASLVMRSSWLESVSTMLRRIYSVEDPNSSPLIPPRPASRSTISAF